MTRSFDQRRQDLEERYRDGLAALDAEVALSAFCPVAPEHIHFAHKAEPWVTYTVKTVADALVILDHFPVLPGKAIDDGCVYVGPQSRAQGTVRFEADELVSVTLDHGRGFRSQKICFWSPLGDKVARVFIEVGVWPWKRLPQCSVRYNGHGEVTRSEHNLPALGEWRRIKWASGSPDSCVFGLYFDSKAKAQTWLAEGA